jgi:hypothetical protein
LRLGIDDCQASRGLNIEEDGRRLPADVPDFKAAHDSQVGKDARDI